MVQLKDRLAELVRKNPVFTGEGVMLADLNRNLTGEVEKGENVKEGRKGKDKSEVRKVKYIQQGKKKKKKG
jgi:hypothetical protein